MAGTEQHGATPSSPVHGGGEVGALARRCDALVLLGLDDAGELVTAPCPRLVERAEDEGRCPPHAAALRELLGTLNRAAR